VIWLTVALVAGLAVAMYVKHARLAGPLAFLLGIVASAGPVGTGVLSAVRTTVAFFGG
jgi:hypothetical protein